MENNMMHKTKTIHSSTLILYLNLPDRVISSLKRNGIYTIGELIQYSPDAIAQFPGIGPKAMHCLEEELGRYGYKLQCEQQEENTDSLALDINCLGLTVQKEVRLRSYGINTIGDFQSITRAKLRAIPSFGEKFLQILEDKIKGYGVGFKQEARENIRDVKISESALPSRTKHILTEAGIKTLGEFLDMPRDEIIGLEGAYKKTLSTAMCIMEEYGYNLTTGRPIGDTDVLTWKLDALEVQRKAISSLNAAGITTIKQLVKLTKADVEGIPGIGETLAQELIKALEEKGLALKQENEQSSQQEGRQLWQSCIARPAKTSKATLETRKTALETKKQEEKTLNEMVEKAKALYEKLPDTQGVSK